LTKTFLTINNWPLCDKVKRSSARAFTYGHNSFYNKMFYSKNFFASQIFPTMVFWPISKKAHTVCLQVTTTLKELLWRIQQSVFESQQSTFYKNVLSTFKFGNNPSQEVDKNLLNTSPSRLRKMIPSISDFFNRRWLFDIHVLRKDFLWHRKKFPHSFQDKFILYISLFPPSLLIGIDRSFEHQTFKSVQWSEFIPNS